MRWFPALALFFFATAQMLADPVQVWVSAGIGGSGCEDSGVTSASCSAGIGGLLDAYGQVSATGSFGMLSADASGSEDFYGLDVYFAASFSDYVLVTGGTGSGTLVAHYQLTASAPMLQDPRLLGDAVVGIPEFSFVQGFTSQNLNINLLDVNPNLNESFSVSSPFQFATPLAFGAATQGLVLFQPTVTSRYSGGLSSGVQLTGFTVLDTSGNVVAGAQVTPQNIAGLDFFTPEPFSGSLVLFGLVVFIWPIVRNRTARRVFTKQFSSHSA